MRNERFHEPVTESFENLGEYSSDCVDYFVVVELKKEQLYLCSIKISRNTNN